MWKLVPTRGQSHPNHHPEQRTEGDGIIQNITYQDIMIEDQLKGEDLSSSQARRFKKLQKDIVKSYLVLIPVEYFMNLLPKLNITKWLKRLRKFIPGLKVN